MIAKINPLSKLTVDLKLLMVDIVHLCSTKYPTGVTPAGLRQILVAAGSRPESSTPSKPLRRQWTRLSAPTKKVIAERYVAGETSVALAREFRVAKSTVLNLLREQNVAVRRQPMTPDQVAKAQELYELGHSLSQLSSTMAIPQDTIRLALKKAGVRLRPATGCNP